MRNPSRYTVLVGLFLLGSVALAIAIAFSLSNGLEWFQATNAFQVRFPIAEGTPGLKPDSAVTLGGQRIGKVTKLEFDATQTHVLVDVRVDAQHPISSDAIISLERPLLGSQSWINISSIGSAGKPLKKGDVIDARRAGGGFLAQLGLTQEDVKKLISSSQDTITNLNELIIANRPKIDGIVNDIAGITHPTSERWPKMLDQFDGTITNVSEFSKTLGPLSTNFNGKIDEFGKLLGNVNTVIDENRGNIQQITTDARAIAGDLRNTTVPSINNIAHSFEAWCATELPELRRSVANLRIITDQSKRAITEIRAQPWRLFFQPSKKELETDVLFWAANAYADAVSDLRSASEGMQNTIALSNAAKPGTGPSTQLLENQYKLLQDSMQDYKKAEQDLLDVLILRAGQQPSGAKPPAEPAKPSK